MHGKGALLKLQGIDSTEAADKLRNQLVQVPVEEAVPLPQGQVYLYEIIGLQVNTTQGQSLGEVVEVLDTSGANDVYVVRNAEREILIPAIPSVVKTIDQEHGEMIVELIPGLI